MTGERWEEEDEGGTGTLDEGKEVWESGVSGECGVLSDSLGRFGSKSGTDTLSFLRLTSS